MSVISIVYVYWWDLSQKHYQILVKTRIHPPKQPQGNKNTLRHPRHTSCSTGTAFTTPRHTQVYGAIFPSISLNWRKSQIRSLSFLIWSGDLIWHSHIGARTFFPVIFCENLSALQKFPYIFLVIFAQRKNCRIFFCKFLRIYIQKFLRCKKYGKNIR